MLATTVPDYRTTLGYCTYVLLLRERERRRELKRIYNAKHYTANPEKGRLRAAKWQAANPEKAREVSRASKARCKAANPEKAREARRLEQMRWRMTHREKARESSRDWARNHYFEHRKYVLKYAYGITLEEFKQILKDQGGVCAICGKEGRMCVDHCHATGKVRGILCAKCNMSIGLMGDSVETLQAAISYLQRTGGQSVRV